MSTFVVVESEPGEHYNEERVSAVHGPFSSEAEALAFAKTLRACEGTVWLAPLTAPGAAVGGQVKHMYFPSPSGEPFLWEDRYPNGRRCP